MSRATPLLSGVYNDINEVVLDLHKLSVKQKLVPHLPNLDTSTPNLYLKGDKIFPTLSEIIPADVNSFVSHVRVCSVCSVAFFYTEIRKDVNKSDGGGGREHTLNMDSADKFFHSITMTATP